MLHISAFPAGIWDVHSVSTVGFVHCAPQLPSLKEGSQVAMLESCLFVSPAPCWWKVSLLAWPEKMPSCSWFYGMLCASSGCRMVFSRQNMPMKVSKIFCSKGLIYPFPSSLRPCWLWNISLVWGVCSLQAHLPQCPMLRLICNVQTDLQLEKHQVRLKFCSSAVVPNQLERANHQPTESHLLQLPASSSPLHHWPKKPRNGIETEHAFPACRGFSAGWCFLTSASLSKSLPLVFHCLWTILLPSGCDGTSDGWSHQVELWNGKPYPGGSVLRRWNLEVRRFVWRNRPW